MTPTHSLSRREFLAASSGAPPAPGALWANPRPAQPAKPVIDFHQHTNYSGRSEDKLIAH